MRVGRASDADDPFADAVVKYGGRKPDFIVLVEQAGVDQVGRLSLHRAVVLDAVRGEVNVALDP